jgi:hypothetical protein
MESGRNMIKLQQYLNGFLKGFLVNNPDRAYLRKLLDMHYEMTDEAYFKYKDEEKAILCRNPFFSPVSLNVYYEIITPSRIRIDISFTG